MKNFIQNYLSFNQWANERIILYLRTLPADCFKKHIISSFSSIDATLQHMLRTQRFWTAFVASEDIQHFDWSVKDIDTNLILDELEIQSAKMKNQLSTLEESVLFEKLSLDMPWCKNQLSRYEYIVHVINHSTFHRGQIITMVRQLGFKEGIPNTDYNMFCTA